MNRPVTMTLAAVAAVAALLLAGCADEPAEAPAVNTDAFKPARIRDVPERRVAAPLPDLSRVSHSGPFRKSLNLMTRAGIPAQDRTGKLSRLTQRLFREETRRIGATAVARLWVGREGEIGAYRFDDHQALQRYAETLPTALRYGNTLLVPLRDRPSNWATLVELFETDGGSLVASAASQPDPRSLVLGEVREALAGYENFFRRDIPDFAGSVWSELVEHEFLTAPPRNPSSPPAVATRVVEVSDRGLTGAGVQPTAAGWVWNAADRTMYLAGSPM